MLRKYLALARAGWAITMEFRAQILIWMMSSLLVVVMLMVWLGISDKGPVQGYSGPDFVSYYLVGLFVRQMTAVWASWELDAAIREGKLSPTLLRPIHPIHNEIAANLAEKGIRIVIVVPIVIAVLLSVRHAPLLLTPLNLAAFLLSLAGAWLICFLSDYLIGIFAFWTSQATAFVQVFFTVRMMFSGVLAPLSLFPDGFQRLLVWSPFPYMMSFSNEILMGRVAGQALIFGFAVQFAWAGLFALAVIGLWRVAMRSYSAVGA